jgi:hypothetical protein
MAWCEANRVGYVFGLARNSRLENARLRSIAPPHTPKTEPARQSRGRTAALLVRH